MQSYPAHRLPPPTVDFSGSVKPNVIRTQFDDGVVRQRRRFESEELVFSVSWSFTDEEFALFKAFMKHRVTSGADWFEIDLPWDSGIKTYQARLVEGAYSATYTGHMHWNVSAQLETRNVSYLSEIVLDQLLAETSVIPNSATGLYTKTQLLELLENAVNDNSINQHNVETVEANYTVKNTDIHTFFRVDSPNDVVISLPDGEAAGFTDEFVCAVSRVGTGRVTFGKVNNATVIDGVGMEIPTRYTAVAVHYVGNNRWQIYGDLVA